MKTAKKENVVDALREVRTGAKTKKVVEKPKVELISYSMKMVIPTGNYANIQPEIVVKAGTVEEAHDYIAPHFNKLWKEYYLCSERRPEPVKPQYPPVQTNPTSTVTNATPSTPEGSAPVSSVAFTKASQAIASCLSMEALDIIQKQIENSVKLTLEDKPELLKLSVLKAQELKNGKVNPA
jgi:hypothetical protein